MSTELSQNALCIQRIIEREADALHKLARRDQPHGEAAVHKIMSTKGRLIVTGMGKAGLIGRKATATFCSTGTPAVFLHAAEAVHGDLGLIGREDLLIAFSNSGETEEVLALLPHVKRCGVPIIGITGDASSSLATRSDLVLDVSVENEADVESPAPTSSTTCMLAMSDALAVCVMRARGFSVDQFAIFHPGGHLGRKLLLKVDELMRSGEHLPLVDKSTAVRDAIMVMTRMGLGCAFVVNDHQKLLGILTDGDLRRLFENEPNPLDDSIASQMTRNPKAIEADALAAEALKLMEDHAISVLPVVDADSRCIGAIHLHDLIRAGLA